MRLTALQDRISLEENQAQVGRTVEVLVAEAEGRKDGATHRLTGRAADNRLVHLALPATAATCPRPGDLVTRRRHARRAVPPGRRLRARPGGTFDVRRTARGRRVGPARSGDDEHSHGGAGDSCGTGGPTGPVVLGPADDRAARCALSCPARPAASRRRGGAAPRATRTSARRCPARTRAAAPAAASVTPGSKSADTSL